MILLSQILKNKFTLDQILHFLPLLIAVFFIVRILSQETPVKISKKIMVLLLLQFVVIFLTSTFLRLEWKFLQKLLFPFYVPAFIVIPAACYLYLKSLTEEYYSFSKKDFFHFLPAIVLWVLLEVISIPFFFGKGKVDAETAKILLKILSFLSYSGLVFGGIIQFGIYLVLGIRQYLKHQKRIKNYFSDLEHIRLQWMKWFLLGYTLFLGTLILTNLDPSTDRTISDLVYLGISSLFVLFGGYHSLKQKDIYQTDRTDLVLVNEKDENEAPVFENVEKQEDSYVKPDKPIEVIEQPDLKLSDAFYSNTLRQTDLKNEILKLLVQEKKYLNVSLSLDDIADELHTNKKYISFVINSMMNTNFYNLVNEYRIKEAQKLISGKEGNQYTIEGIGNLSGFKSRSTFISAFKKYTGKTPSDFKQSNLISSQN